MKIPKQLPATFYDIRRRISALKFYILTEIERKPSFYSVLSSAYCNERSIWCNQNDFVYVLPSILPLSITHFLELLDSEHWVYSHAY